jgi:hypothetical protein
MFIRKIYCFALLSLCGICSLKSAEIIRGPYVEGVGLHSAVFRWSFDKPSFAWLQYGPKPNCDRLMTISPEKKKHTIHLYGLSPGTLYCYKISTNIAEDASIRLAEGSFKTLKQANKSSFNFLALGESGTVTQRQYQIAAAMEKFEPDFVIHTGGITGLGLDEDADPEYFKPFKNMMLKCPFFLTMGISAYGQDGGGKAFIKRNYLSHHTMTWSEATPHYYYFDNANARFIFLDASSVKGVKYAPSIDEDSRQIAWLKHALSRARGVWKFIFINIPVYSTGNEGSNKKLIKILEPIFQTYGADIVFQGYDTNYERTHQIKDGKKVERGGVIYITLGGGGRPLGRQNKDKQWSNVFKDKHHFARVEVRGRKFTMTVYDLDEKTIDKFQVVR